MHEPSMPPGNLGHVFGNQPLFAPAAPVSPHRSAVHRSVFRGAAERPPVRPPKQEVKASPARASSDQPLHLLFATQAKLAKCLREFPRDSKWGPGRPVWTSKGAIQWLQANGFKDDQSYWSALEHAERVHAYAADATPPQVASAVPATPPNAKAPAAHRPRSAHEEAAWGRTPALQPPGGAPPADKARPTFYEQRHAALASSPAVTPPPKPNFVLDPAARKRGLSSLYSQVFRIRHLQLARLHRRVSSLPPLASALFSVAAADAAAKRPSPFAPACLPVRRLRRAYAAKHALVRSIGLPAPVELGGQEEVFIAAMPAFNASNKLTPFSLRDLAQLPRGSLPIQKDEPAGVEKYADPILLFQLSPLSDEKAKLLGSTYPFAHLPLPHTKQVADALARYLTYCWIVFAAQHRATAALSSLQLRTLTTGDRENVYLARADEGPSPIFVGPSPVLPPPPADHASPVPEERPRKPRGATKRAASSQLAARDRPRRKLRRLTKQHIKRKRESDPAA